MDFTQDIWSAPDDEFVCWCAGVSKGEIVRAKQRGAVTLDDVRAATGACRQGQCREKNPRGR
ncbi:(2Fe-2S)-binding protein [uncultured Bilophila sp.]|uniref:(2Fe-2S)-binding protein n=1 Tax=uncultured Bilophila sp. TaxID=529385 RepID=UPI00280A79B3|nr:(2Fe-2S)-binding protein [uncultured Bilophila sp.]